MSSESGDRSSESGAPSGGRPYIGIFFECCGVYSRVYRQPEQREYVGRCPRCLRAAKIRVGEGGTSERIFRAR